MLLCRAGSELHKRAGAEKGFELYCLAPARLSFLNPLYMLRLFCFLRAHRPDALILNLPSDLKAAAPMAKAVGVRQIIYRRGSDLPVRDSFLNRLLYGRIINRLIVNSEATRRSALVNNPSLIPPERISVLPSGLDCAALDAALTAAKNAQQVAALDASKNAQQVAALSAEQDAQQDATQDVKQVAERKIKRDLPSSLRHAPPRPFIIGNAGRLTRQKGQHLLLRLAARLCKADFSFRLIIAGSGDLEGRLKELARRLGVDDKVIFTGFLENLAPFWTGIDIFISSSLWEGFGNVILEAGLAEKPVFAFNVSNLPELVAQGENGLLFPLPAGAEKVGGGDSEWETDPGLYPELDDLAVAVMKLAAYPDVAKGMGRKGRERALGYGQELCMDRLMRLLAGPDLTAP
jgi:glycosyltransferase involved in cell wall biosynthesis